MAIETSSPEANYATRTNIVHPESVINTAGSIARVDAAEARGVADIQARKAYEGGVAITFTGAKIKRGN